MWSRALVRIPRKLLPKISNNYRIYTGYGIMFGKRADPSPFSEEFKCYAGSYWMTLNKKSVDALIEGYENNVRLREHYRRVVVPEESYAQTILLNRPDLEISRHELRYYSWEGSRFGQTKSLDFDDLDNVLCKYYFARKLDTELNPDVLNQIDRYLDGIATSNDSS